MKFLLQNLIWRGLAELTTLGRGDTGLLAVTAVVQSIRVQQYEQKSLMYKMSRWLLLLLSFNYFIRAFLKKK